MMAERTLAERASAQTGLSRRMLVRGAMAVAAIGALPGRAYAGLLDALGLKKMLGNASDGALNKLGASDGFYRDVAVRILLPGTKGKLASKLMRAGDKIGVTTKLTKSLNDAASLAALEAKPVFRSAIDGLKITDVPGLALKNDGATQYLKKSASDELLLKIKPLVSAALGKVGAFDQLSKLSKAGGLLAPLGLTDAKLTDSVSNQALNGIFSYIGKEEGQLRSSPGGLLDKIL